MKYDIDLLKLDLKKTASYCRLSKMRLAEAQRALSLAPKDADWHERKKLRDAINTARGDTASASLTMTKLCVFRAHLRGRTHLSDGSGLLGFVKEWISDLECDYALAETESDRPAA